MSAAAALDHQQDPDPAQIALRLFATVERYRGVPPDRALWREAIRIALGGRTGVTVGGRRISRSTLTAVAWAVHGRRDHAGHLHGTTQLTLAADSGFTERTVQVSMRWLGACGLVVAERPNRRAAMRYRLNLGGLEWAAVRARIEQVQQARKRQRSWAVSASESGHGVMTQSGHGVRTHRVDQRVNRATGRGRPGADVGPGTAAQVQPPHDTGTGRPCPARPAPIHPLRRPT